MTDPVLVRYVTERFSWQWYYWYLTNEGITYLREYLHLPEEVVPATLKKSSRPAARPGQERGEREDGGKGGKGWGRGGDRDDGYRRGGFGGDGGKGGGFGGKGN